MDVVKKVFKDNPHTTQSQMGDILKNKRLLNPSLTGTITLNGVDVTKQLNKLLVDGGVPDVTKPVAVDDSKVRILTAEIEGLKALCKQLSTKVDNLSKPPKEPPKEPDTRETRSKTEK